MSTIKDAVQPDAWYKALPRAIYAGLEQVPTSEPWFSVYKIAPNIYAFYEDGHFQEVISYLVIGSEKAMLVDSGMGIGNIKKAVEDLYDGEVFVLNTHSHFDHTGCDWMFEKVYIFNHPSAIYRLQNGLPHENVYPSLHGDSVVKPYPDGFDPETYVIKPTAFETIEDGAVFDLGGSVWHVMHTPGHSPDSIMIYNEEEKIIFTGDTYYPATLYAHLDSPDGMKSVFETYQEIMHKVGEKFSDYTVIPSHNEPLRPGKVLQDVAEAFDIIAAKGQEPLIDSSGLKKYVFEDFCIVTK